MLTAALVADPTGDTDRKTHFEIVTQFAFVAGKAMGDAAGQPWQVVLQDGHECVMAVALVQEHGLCAFDGQFELLAESALLVCV